MDKKILLIWMSLLTMLAGAVNAISVGYFSATTVSHVTGLISKVSIFITIGSWEFIWVSLRVILAFFLGALLTGFITGERAFELKKRYGFIIISLGLLFIIPYFIPEDYAILLLAFIMGMQNGMIVSFKGIVVRMTHMSGNVTDLAVFLGYRLRGNKNEDRKTGLIPFIAIISFLIGGVLGVLVYKEIGDVFFFIVSGLYVLVGILYFITRSRCIDKNFNGIPDELE